MYKRFTLVSLLGFSLLGSCTQVVMAGQVSPTPVSQVDHSGTATGSAVTVLTANTCAGSTGCRADCTLQNTGANVMYYSFTGTATSSSRQLQPGFIMNCSGGVSVDQTALSLLGTNGDTYSLSESFPTGQ